MLERVEGDAYAVLGISRDADDAAIAQAHRRLARRHHPDVAGESAQRRMIRINAAYDAIRTPERRAAYDRARRQEVGRDGTGGAGRPPGNPSGSVLGFGRHVGWSLGEVARVDPGYLLWLAERPEGSSYRDEINAILSRLGMRTAKAENTPPWRRGVQYR
jgi:curved DNA-binding protein CbpA